MLLSGHQVGFLYPAPLELDLVMCLFWANEMRANITSLFLPLLIATFWKAVSPLVWNEDATEWNPQPTHDVHIEWEMNLSEKWTWVRNEPLLFYSNETWRLLATAAQPRPSYWSSKSSLSSSTILSGFCCLFIPWTIISRSLKLIYSLKAKHW